MRVSWEFNIYNLKSLLTCYRFLTRCEYYLWLDSKYNERRCDVLVQNKTIHSLNLQHLIEYFWKWQPEPLVKPSMWYEGAVVALRHHCFNLSDLLVFCWWFMSNIRTFSLNSIGCVTKCGPAGILEEIQLTDVCKVHVLKSSYRKIWSNIWIKQMKSKRMSDKMNKEQSATPPWIWFV